MPGPGTLRAQHKRQREYRVGGCKGQRTECTEEKDQKKVEESRIKL